MRNCLQNQRGNIANTSQNHLSVCLNTEDFTKKRKIKKRNLKQNSKFLDIWNLTPKGMKFSQ